MRPGLQHAKDRRTVAGTRRLCEREVRTGPQCVIADSRGNRNQHGYEEEYRRHDENQGDRSQRVYPNSQSSWISARSVGAASRTHRAPC